MATIYARKQSKGTIYTLQWRMNGKRMTKSLGYVSPKEADRALKQLELDLLDGIPDSCDVPKLKVFVGEYKSWHATMYPASAERVAQIIDMHLIPYFGLYALNEIRLRDVEGYQQKRVQTRKKTGDKELVKAATVNKETKTLVAVLNRAIRLEIILKHSLKHHAPLPELDSKATGYFTEPELDLIYERSATPNWWRLLVKTGLRVSEAQQLTWSNITDKGIMIESTERNRTKSGKWRLIPVRGQVSTILLNLWRDRVGGAEADVWESIDEKIFPSMERSSFSRKAADDIRKAGLEGSAHKFRHTFASLLVIKGVPLYSVQKLLGHASIKTTERYAHLGSEYFNGLDGHF